MDEKVTRARRSVRTRIKEQRCKKIKKEGIKLLQLLLEEDPAKRITLEDIFYKE